LIKDLNIRPETLHLVQERAGNILEAIGIGKDFFSRTPTVLQVRERMEKWNMKFKKLLHNKKMVSKLMRPLMEWEKIFKSYISKD
jgi:DNA repair protein RadC